MNEEDSTGLREKLQQNLNSALKSRSKVSIGTLRLILAAVKDRDIALRGQGGEDLIDNSGIVAILRTMIKQRNESILAFEKGNRPDRAAIERAEITVIEHYLPPQLEEAQSKEYIIQAIKSLDAKSVKDMGKVMSHLKENYGDVLNMALAGKIVRETLLK